MSKKPPPMEASEDSAKKNINIGGLDLFFKKETSALMIIIRFYLLSKFSTLTRTFLTCTTLVSKMN